MRPLLRVLLHGSLSAARPRSPTHSYRSTSAMAEGRVSRAFGKVCAAVAGGARQDVEKGAMWDGKSASTVGSSVGSCQGREVSTVTTAIGGGVEGTGLAVGTMPPQGCAQEGGARAGVSPRSIIVETRWEISRQGNLNGDGDEERVVTEEVAGRDKR